MNSLFKTVKNFFQSVFSSQKKIVVSPQAEDEYDGWLGV